MLLLIEGRSDITAGRTAPESFRVKIWLVKHRVGHQKTSNRKIIYLVNDCFWEVLDFHTSRLASISALYKREAVSNVAKISKCSQVQLIIRFYTSTVIYPAYFPYHHSTWHLIQTDSLSVQSCGSPVSSWRSKLTPCPSQRSSYGQTCRKSKGWSFYSLLWGSELHFVIVNNGRYDRWACGWDDDVHSAIDQGSYRVGWATSRKSSAIQSSLWHAKTRDPLYRRTPRCFRLEHVLSVGLEQACSKAKPGATRSVANQPPI